MALDDIDDWTSRARAATQRAMEGFEERVGYEPDAQEIRLASSVERLDLSDLPDQARAFFSSVDEICWPDIWNGCFLGPASVMVQRFRDRDPGTVAIGSQEHRSFMIGSDGGGAYFVLDLDDLGAVLRVVEVTVQAGVLRGVVDEIAPDLDSFLECLVQNANAVADGGEPSF